MEPRIASAFLAGLCLCVCTHLGAEGFILDTKNPEPGGDQRFIGTATLQGRYFYGQLGELCLETTKRSARKLPFAGQQVDVCFSNQEEVLRLLAVDQAIKALDFVKTCELGGKATIEITDLWSGEGPARRWYTARMLRVIEKQRYVTHACNASQETHLK